MKKCAVITCMFFIGICHHLPSACSAIAIRDARPGESVLQHIQRTGGSLDQTLYRQIIGLSIK